MGVADEEQTSYSKRNSRFLQHVQVVPIYSIKS